MKYLILFTLLSNPKFEVLVHCEQMETCNQIITTYEMPPSFPSLTSDAWGRRLFMAEELKAS
jgi:hypothetical protein